MKTPVRDRDVLVRFLFEHTHVRGELVHLDASWRAVVERHPYPAPVRALLGQAMAAAALLIATVKVEEGLTLQIQGSGPVNLLVVQVTGGRTLRGMAQWRDPVPADAPLSALVGEARLAMTLDSGPDRDSYQGIVGLAGEATLAEALETYFRQSEQLETRLWLVADEARAAGMLLQSLPSETADEDVWRRTVHLGTTLTDEELLALPQREILHRLFHEEDVRLFEPEPFGFRCSCSRDRIERVLRGLGYDEVRDILETEGQVEVTCEFCNQVYRFDRVDVEGLFAAADQPQVPPTRH